MNETLSVLSKLVGILFLYFVMEMRLLIINVYDEPTERSNAPYKKALPVLILGSALMFVVGVVLILV